MATFMLTHNPAKWDWGAERERIVDATRHGALASLRWSTGSRNSGITAGARAFLLQQGPHHNGLIGSGWFTGAMETGAHWTVQGKTANYAWLTVDTLLPSEQAVAIDDLLGKNERRRGWLVPQASGVKVPEADEQDLEDFWQEHTGNLGSAPAATVGLDTDQRAFALALVHRRQGQPEFRRRLIEAYRSTCAVTGSTEVEVLQAAHIHPYRGQHTNLVTNGLLLRADIHNLFDAGLLAISADGHVLVSPDVKDPTYRALHGRRAALPTDLTHAPDPESLAAHRRAARLDVG